MFTRSPPPSEPVFHVHKVSALVDYVAEDYEHLVSADFGFDEGYCVGDSVSPPLVHVDEV